MNKLLTTQAFHAFREGRFHTARNLYHQASERLGKPLYETNLELCRRRESSHFLTGRERLKSSDATPEPLITYCVPAMNRLEDIQQTLPHNLSVLANFRSARLMVNLFDRDDASFLWVREQLHSHITEGRLIVNRLPPMESWHMSRGKNSFQPFLSEGYCSSLDSDNYLSEDEVIKTKQAIREFGDCLIHYFSGDWGDGTCGRITLPVALYQDAGYTSELYPRQFDELSLIANAIAQRKNLTVVTRYGVNILHKTRYLREFTALNKLAPCVIPCDLGTAKAPENGKDIGYAERDPKLKFYSELNGYYSIYKASHMESARQHFAEEIAKVQDQVLKAPEFPQLAEQTLEVASNATKQRPWGNAVHYAVVDGIGEAQAHWLECQRGRGARHFVLIDATADKNLGDHIQGKDVTVMTPKVGDVATFKEFWISCAKVLMRRGTQTVVTLPLEAMKSNN